VNGNLYYFVSNIKTNINVVLIDGRFHLYCLFARIGWDF
jgi:hypothetical protein